MLVEKVWCLINSSSNYWWFLFLKDGNNHVKGLTILTAAVFIVGEMSGTGVLSLPNSMNQSHWAGLVLIFGLLFYLTYLWIGMTHTHTQICILISLLVGENIFLETKQPSIMIRLHIKWKLSQCWFQYEWILDRIDSLLTRLKASK